MPRVGKFLVLFSRPGQRVIVDYRGDVVVRPSPHEVHIRNGGAVCRRHTFSACLPSLMWAGRSSRSVEPVPAGQ